MVVCENIVDKMSKKGRKRSQAKLDLNANASVNFFLGKPTGAGVNFARGLIQSNKQGYPMY